MNSEIFHDLIILEVADNHLGDLSRGLKIIEDFSKVIKDNNIRAAFKFHFRDTDSFIHPEYKNCLNLRYITKTKRVKMSDENYTTLIHVAREKGHMVISTPFDEWGVDFCEKLDIQIIKIASADINNIPLIEKIIKTRKPCIVSTGGYYLKDLDDLVNLFEVNHVPLAINHCVSLYPTEDNDLELHQIDFLKHRYPNHVIGFSSHEYHDWASSMFIAYGKGVRTFERHVDIDCGGISVSKYCSTPEQVNIWFKAFNKAREMCGGNPTVKRTISDKENRYINELIRGIYAKRDLPDNYIIKPETVWEDLYMAVPLNKRQISCREAVDNIRILKAVKKDDQIIIDNVDASYSFNPKIKEMIYNRGL